MAYMLPPDILNFKTIEYVRQRVASKESIASVYVELICQYGGWKEELILMEMNRLETEFQMGQYRRRRQLNGARFEFNLKAVYFLEKELVSSGANTAPVQVTSKEEKDVQVTWRLPISQNRSVTFNVPASLTIKEVKWVSQFLDRIQTVSALPEQGGYDNWPIPLAPGRNITLQLPVPITPEEMRRIQLLLVWIATPEQKDVPVLAIPERKQVEPEIPAVIDINTEPEPAELPRMVREPVAFKDVQWKSCDQKVCSKRKITRKGYDLKGLPRAQCRTCHKYIQPVL